jgi:hypothetical protein
MTKPVSLTENRIAPPLGLTRRQLLPLLGATAASAIILPAAFAAARADMSGKPSGTRTRFVYVGTYTFPGTAPGGTHQSQARGIYVFRMNPSNGGLSLLQIVEIPNPSYLALDPTLQHLYSVNEMTDGAVSAFAINQTKGMLTFLNMMPTNGQDTTHLSVQTLGAVPVCRQLHQRQLSGLSDQQRRFDRQHDRQLPERRQWDRTQSRPPGGAARASDSD